MRAGIYLIAGFLCPDSQLITVKFVAPMRFPASSWVMPRMSLRLRMWSPKVLGSKLDILLINDLRVTGTHGKKATPLCPCGYLGHPSGKCRCTPDQVARYRSRISGPLLDRIDLQIEVPALPQEEMTRQAQGDAFSTVRERVTAARERALARQKKPNTLLATRDIDKYCAPDDKGETLLKQAISRMGLSARAYHRILKVARTIADLADVATISAAHVAEAIQYRRFERG